MNIKMDKRPRGLLFLSACVIVGSIAITSIASAAILKEGSSTTVKVSVSATGCESTLVTTGKGFVHGMVAASGNPIVAFLPGAPPVQTPGVANPADAEIRDFAYFKTTSNGITIFNTCDGTVTGTASISTFFDPTPFTDLSDATLLAQDDVTASGTGVLVGPTGSSNIEGQLDIQGTVTFSDPTPFVHLGEVISGEFIVGPVGSIFTTQPGTLMTVIADPSVPAGATTAFLGMSFGPVVVPGLNAFGTIVTILLLLFTSVGGLVAYKLRRPIPG